VKKYCIGSSRHCRAVKKNYADGSFSCRLGYPINNKPLRNLCKSTIYLPCPKVECPKPMTWADFYDSRSYHED
jgi:hypothetical protein